ncbi:hypothetical protein QZH41_008721, partial [Actinostola sp. cb2023]
KQKRVRRIDRLQSVRQASTPTCTCTRGHNDIKLLYKAFQSKRKKMRSVVKGNIALHCAAPMSRTRLSSQ